MREGKAAQHRIRDVEDDGVEVEHFLAEPSNDPVSIDDFFILNKAPDMNSCGRESFTLQGGDCDERLQVKLSEVNQVENHNAIGPSAVCEDYLLDTEFVDKDSECEDIPREGLSFEKSTSETHSSGCNGSESSTIGVLESSSISNGKPGFKNGTNDCIALCNKLHGVSKSKCDCPDQGKEKTEQKSPIIYTSQNRRKLQSRLGLSSSPGKCDMDVTSFSDLHQDSEEASILSDPRKIKHVSSASHTIVRLNDTKLDKPVKIATESSSQKRSRKPPVRYIDEFTSNAPCTDERHKIYDMPMDEILNLRTSSKHDSGHNTSKLSKLSGHEGRYGRSPNKPLASNRVAVALSKEFSPVTRLDSDEESDSDTPGNFSMPRNGFRYCGDRRKHQKVWTLPEVVKLVDGISHYGVGHWTEIQRLFFPTSTCRTPVDLRDKWRNLLKASNASMQNDLEERDEESQKNGHRQLPIEILHRISELSRIYPYPVKRTSNNKRALKYSSTRK